MILLQVVLRVEYAWLCYANCVRMEFFNYSRCIRSSLLHFQIAWSSFEVSFPAKVLGENILTMIGKT